MPDLYNTLQGTDLSFLRLVAEAWGIELRETDFHKALLKIVDTLQDAESLQDMVESLTPTARDALSELLAAEGRMPWPLFTRRFGQVRSMGPGRRERERPDITPASPAEVLWYRGLIGQAFLNIPPEPQEYAFIPDEFLVILDLPASTVAQVMVQPASPEEMKFLLPARDRILDDACTILAGLRSGLSIDDMQNQGFILPSSDLVQLLAAAELLDQNFHPRPDSVQNFLEAPRPKSLLHLAQAWIKSHDFNELHLLPELVCEGGWSNNPHQTRDQVLEWLRALPSGTWWSLPAFIEAVHQQKPDFQRHAGDYDSWFIRRKDTNEYLRGFSSWQSVDGALLKYMICGPLHWLGFVSLASPEKDQAPAAFCTTDWFEDLLKGNPPSYDALEDRHAQVNLDGTFFIHRSAPRALRYQAARFAEWLPSNKGGYNYRITPYSLNAARTHGLRSSQFIQVLNRLSPDPLPPLLVKAIERWEISGVEAAIEPILLLRVSSPEIIQEIRKTRAANYLGESLSPTIFIIRPGSVEKLSRVLAEIGYLAEVKIQHETQPGISED